ncbi:MAG: hypothetical protein ACE37K_15745 [Planctomycetota bacterium]
MTTNETQNETIGTPAWDALASETQAPLAGITDSALCCIYCLEADQTWWGVL